MEYLFVPWRYKLFERVIGRMSQARLGYLLAPWRYKYFELPKVGGCLFCRGIAAGRDDHGNLVLVRGERALIMLNRYPYSTGALMIAPIVHEGEFRKIEDETLLEMNRMLKYGMNILDAAIHPAGFNVGINQGEAAGAGVKDHLHIHLVPRWTGDTNFMTTTGNTRVLSEDIERMYDRLRRVIDTKLAGGDE